MKYVKTCISVYTSSVRQAYILQAHYDHAAVFHYLRLFQSAQLQDLQVLPMK